MLFGLYDFSVSWTLLWMLSGATIGDAITVVTTTSAATESSSDLLRNRPREGSDTPTRSDDGIDTMSLPSATATNTALSPFGLRRSYGRIAGAGTVFIFLFLLSASGAHNAAQDLFHVFWFAPSGSLRSPAGIIQLCRNIQMAASGQMGAFIALLMAVYLTLQTFCIPGTIALNAICGALVGTPAALCLCVCAGTVGASCCYLLSSVVGTRLAESVDGRLMQGKGIPKLKSQVARFRADLLAYLIFLRLTPVLPNWLINLASPVVSVPLRPFVLATMLGIIPQTYLSVRFGSAANALASAESVGHIVTVWDTLLIAVVGVVVIVAARLRKKFGAAQ